MADETHDNDTDSKNAPRSRILSKKDANRIAAAKAYVLAMKKVGEEVPEWIQELAKHGR